ncbi:hypothetical protein WA026_017257 [Henosepilachna vigintioctopunctata]|uniref:Uncharacterized protein n=1 Tax=Henosepilachna vigintioctopunctata TaxID=420089 RepID=A0AAW1UP45_9CUCU
MDVKSHRLHDVFTPLLSPNFLHSPRLCGSVAFVLVVKLSPRKEVASFDKSQYKMPKKNKAGSSKSERPSMSSVLGPARKTFCAGDPSFEQEVCVLLLASDQSDNEENIENFLY